MEAGMKLLLLNGLALGTIAVPGAIVLILSYRSEWVCKHEEVLNGIAWIMGLIICYFFVLPILGLMPNPSFNR